jgi:hypothetical protein
VPEDLKSKKDRWRTRFREIQNEIWSDDQPSPDHLYHYSSLVNIRKILSGRELWLFDVRTMPNDSRDGIYWVEVFWSVLRRKSVPPWIVELFRPGNTLGLGEDWYSYVSCLSAESRLEDQWEQFADHGAGCAVEVSFAALEGASDGGHAYGYTPMCYGAKEQTTAAEKTIDKAIEFFRSERENLTHNEARAFWREAVFPFLWCGTRFKHPRFERQHEWRVFMSRPSEFDGVSNFGSRRYVPWLFPPGLVTGIVKGPNCGCPNEELEGLLTAAGYPPKVRRALLESAQPVSG